MALKKFIISIKKISQIIENYGHWIELPSESKVFQGSNSLDNFHPEFKKEVVLILSTDAFWSSVLWKLDYMTQKSLENFLLQKFWAKGHQVIKLYSENIFKDS